MLSIKSRLGNSEYWIKSQIQLLDPTWLDYVVEMTWYDFFTSSKSVFSQSQTDSIY